MSTNITFPVGTPIMSDILALASLFSFLTSTLTLLSFLYLQMYQNTSKRFIIYTLISEILHSIAYMGRFNDWGSVPRQGFWCQWSGFGTVVGSNSIGLWTAGPATYLLIIFVQKRQPSFKFEVMWLTIWPLFSILPAALPYCFYPATQVYSPYITGQCYFKNIKVAAYIFVFWDSAILVYILFAYLAIMVQVYYISKKMEHAWVISQPVDKGKRRKFWLVLAVSPVVFWVLYIGIIVSRILELTIGSVQIEFLRVAVVVYALNGVFISMWFAYSCEIWDKLSKKWFGDREEDEERTFIN